MILSWSSLNHHFHTSVTCCGDIPDHLPYLFSFIAHCRLCGCGPIFRITWICYQEDQDDGDSVVGHGKKVKWSCDGRWYLQLPPADGEIEPITKLSQH